MRGALISRVGLVCRIYVRVKMSRAAAAIGRLILSIDFIIDTALDQVDRHRICISLDDRDGRLYTFRVVGGLVAMHLFALAAFSFSESVFFSFSRNRRVLRISFKAMRKSNPETRPF